MQKKRRKRREYTEKELEYLCKYYETDGPKSLASSWGRTERTVSLKINTLRERGLYDYYKNLNKHW